jgi:conjugal transfer/type IV secretion protein DotA/TraY
MIYDIIKGVFMKFLTSLTEPVRSLNIWQVFKFKYLMLFLMGAMPTLALADNLFNVPSGDISVRVLSSIFGGLVDETSGVKADPMMAAIKMFNGSILIIGGILAAYTILAGTLGTAHDGEMLGKKFSSVWIPIRYSVGTALVLPVVGGGYCVMQAIVMWLVLQGIGLADQVWSSFMSNPTTTAKPVSNRMPQETIMKVATSAFTSSICYQSYAKTISESNALLKFGQYNYSLTKVPGGYAYGDSTSNLRRYGCGKLDYAEKNIGVDEVVSNPTPQQSTNNGFLGSFNDIFEPMDMRFIGAAHKQQTDILVNKMDQLAKRAIDNPDMSAEDGAKIYAEIEKSSAEYITNVVKTIESSAATDGFAKIKQAATEQGWILAGAWFTRIIQMNEQVHNALNATPTAEINAPALDGIIFSDASKYLRTADIVLSNGNQNAAIDTFNTEEKEEKGAGKKVSSSGLLMKIEAKFTEFITGMNLYELKNDSRHPLIIVHDLGSRIVIATISLMTALAGAAFLAGTLSPTLSVVPSVLTVLQFFMGLPMQAIMTIGLGCQYILPNLPYLIWIGCIVGWVLLVIEAIIAAPLWAIMHLHPNGDDLTGRGGNGYMLVLSLLLRPVLMVFGMMAAIVISSVIGEFINKTFFEVFANNTGTMSGFTAMLALTMGTFLYFTVMFTFIRKCFGIMHMLPDQLMKWIGGSGGGLGEFANEFNGAAEKATGSAAALAGGVASGTAKQAFNKMDGKVREIQGKMGTADGVKDGGIDGFIGNNMYALTGNDPNGDDPGVKPHSGERLARNGSGNVVDNNNQPITPGSGGIPMTVLRTSQGEEAYSNKVNEMKSKKQSQESADRDSFIDAKSGAGTAAFVTNAERSFANSLGMDANTDAGKQKIADFREAYTQGIAEATLSGGKVGRADFQASVETAQQSNFGGSNPIQALENIGNNVADNRVMSSIDSKVASYGGGVAEFMQNLAKGPDGRLDKQKAHMYANSLNKLEQAYDAKGLNGAEQVGNDLSMINTSSDPKAEFKDIYDKK